MIRLILAARALRAFADGFVAVLLPAYLLALGYGEFQIGLLSTASLFGSALATLAVGRWGYRFSGRRLLLGAAVVMAATGLTLIVGEPIREFTALSFWLKMGLIAIAVVTTIMFGRSLKPATLAVATGGEFSGGIKAATVITLLIWITIIFLGRAIAYDTEVWGSLSLH